MPPFCGKGSSEISNRVTYADSEAVEAAYLAKLAAINKNEASDAAPVSGQLGPQTEEPLPQSEMVVPFAKSVQKRSKAHLAFVASQPCLICKVKPCDAHHLKIARARSLGRKVSDEFTVPLCHAHHQQLHQHGHEANWWANIANHALGHCKRSLGTKPRSHSNGSLWIRRGNPVGSKPSCLAKRLGLADFSELLVAQFEPARKNSQSLVCAFSRVVSSERLKSDVAPGISSHRKQSYRQGHGGHRKFLLIIFETAHHPRFIFRRHPHCWFSDR